MGSLRIRCLEGRCKCRYVGGWVLALGNASGLKEE